jgi:regulator of sirC expression with transglutaminase-like and TPR domain
MHRLAVWTFGTLFFLLLGTANATAGATTQVLTEKVEELFALGRDWADIKLTADGIADPSKDTTEARAEVARLATNLQAFIKRMQPRNDHETLYLLKMFVYQSGPWNEQKPFAYDLTDPFGKIREHRYLANYLEGRKGNCITMPILFAILGRSIGLKMTLAEAPRHMYVVFIDDKGRTWNLETTGGARYTRDSHIRLQLPMSDKAIQNGLYMKPLTEEEAVAAMASVVVEELMRLDEFEQAIAISDMLLKRAPKSVYLMLARGSAFGTILNRDILSKYTRIQELTPEQLRMAEIFSLHNQLAFETAEGLGWTEKDGERDLWPPLAAMEGDQ